MTEPKKPPLEDLGSIPSIVENLITSAQIVPAQVELNEDRLARTTREIRDIEDRLLLQGLDVIEGVGRFAEVDKKTGKVSNAMLDEYGNNPERMELMKRLALYGQMSAKEAPVGISVMSRVVVGLARARAQEKSAPRKMNVAVLHVGGGIQLPTQQLEDE